MADEKKADAHHGPDPMAPLKKLAAVGGGFLIVSFCFMLGAGFLKDGAVNINEVFNVMVKLSLGTIFAGIVYLVLKDDPPAH